MVATMGGVIEGVDYAWDRPRIADLARAGKKFASRYLSYNTTGKNLSLSEAKALAAAGISVVANWEWSAGDAKTSANDYDTGVKYAKEARRQALACGMPAGRPIYFSVDFSPSSSDWDDISEYFRGIRSVLGLAGTGIYGGYDTIAHAVNGKWASWFWQTYAWSGGRWHPACHVQQYRNGVTLGGADLDLDRALVADYGQWMPGIIPTLEDDMTDEQARQLYNLDRLNTALLAGQTTVTKLQTQDGQLVDMPLAIAAQAKAAADSAAASLAIVKELRDRPVAVDYDLLADAIVRRVLTPPA